MKFQFVALRRDTGQVSVYQVYWMEESFRRLGVPVRVAQNGVFTETLAKALAKLRALRKISRNSETLSIVPVNGLSEFMTFPVCYFNELATYCFDCWPARYEEWVAFFRRHRPLVAFISAKASVEYMQKRLPDMHFIWAPEATDPAAYDNSVPLEDRKIDLLELGRRSDAFHQQVRPALAADNRVHLFERVKGEKIFGSDRQALVDGLANAKMVACFPGSMTDPYFGGLETMTHRYVETMASGCLPVGRAPAELIELFGYNPVVEVDMSSAAQQIRSILDDIGRWKPLIQKNTARLNEVGTWDVRARTMLEEIKTNLRLRQVARGMG
jgi:hypothetical protein